MHFNLSSNYTYSFADDFILRLNGGGQYSLHDLVNSEQKGITGSDKLSAFTSGAISGDEVWYARGQLNRQYKLSNSLMVSPYVYGAGGVAYINQPTATERVSTVAKSVGFGLEFGEMMNIFLINRLQRKLSCQRIGLQAT